MSLAATRSETRHEIQALRAAAVLLVIAYHYWPTLIRGGFVGVDVFFVISGFLITAHLLRDLNATGRIRFAAFYARRARRILPAAVTVLLVCLAGIFVVSSIVVWSDHIAQVLGSALFVENWFLAISSTDYLGATAPPSTVQHYWSLSVEEQFYVFWPALLVGVHWVASKAAPARVMRVTAIAMAAVVAASFTYSVFATFSDPAPAFFNTGARVWELGAGALLACGGVAKSGRRSIRLIVSLLGWTLITASALLLDTSVVFPGFAAAVPVVGAVLVIWAGMPEGSKVWHYLASNRVVRVLAETSFAAYLWHWPLLIFARQALGDDLPHSLRLGLVVVTLVLAWVTTLLVERPLRFGSLSRLRPQATAVFATMAVVAIVLPSTASLVVLDRSLSLVPTTASLAVSTAVCVGAEARDPASPCLDGPYAALFPNPLVRKGGVSVLHEMGCAVQHSTAGLKSCDFGEVKSDVKVALVGDSHAMKMYPAVERLAVENGWHMVTFLKGACMYTTAPSPNSTCDQWRNDVADRLRDEGPWDLVVTLSVINVRGDSEPEIDALRAAWRPLLDEGATVVVIADNPELPQDPRPCIVKNMTDVSVCDVQRSSVDLSDIQTVAAEGQDGVHVVDLTPFYCDEETCFMTAGGILLYMDRTHLNDEYTRTLAPYIAGQVEEFAPELFTTRAPQ